MNILIECPYCEQRFERDETLSGMSVLCPKCKREIKIPTQGIKPEPKEARIIGGKPASESIPQPPDKEETVLEFQPVLRAFLGQIILGILLIVIIVGFFILLDVLIKIASRRYRVTSQRLFVTTGLIARRTDELELFRIIDVKVDQGLFARILRYGTISVFSTDDTTPQINLIGIGNPVEVKETLRTLFRAARKREGVRPTEFIEPDAAQWR